MRIQCGCAQTGFDPVQCTLGVQCGQAFSLVSARSRNVANLSTGKPLCFMETANRGDKVGMITAIAGLLS